ncbi:MAG: serine/threonine-protein kinase, partial [Myxococcota bacterium]
MRCTICHRRIPPGRACPSHEHISAPESDPLRGQAMPTIAGYTVHRALGRGGFATVYLASAAPDAVASEPIVGELAIKVAEQRDDPRMPREAVALRRIGAPSAPRFITDGHTDDGRPFLAMEFIPGDSLAVRLAERRYNIDSGAGYPAVIDAIANLCRAVSSMHRAGVIHRDLKPENIFFRADDSAALIDFGLARLREEADDDDQASDPTMQLTRTDERVGTYHYMAPEQWLGNTGFDERTDIYALGVIAFEMLTGRPPFVGRAALVRHGHVTAQCPRASDFGPVPRTVDDILARCMAKDKARRYASADELAAALRHTVADIVAGARPTRPRRRKSRATRRPVALLSLHSSAGAARLKTFAE